jgi:hypothetical protein
MKKRLAWFDKPEGVVFIGRTQEKIPLFAPEKRRKLPLDCAPVFSQHYPSSLPRFRLTSHSAPSHILELSVISRRKTENRIVRAMVSVKGDRRTCPIFTSRSPSSASALAGQMARWSRRPSIRFPSWAK